MARKGRPSNDDVSAYRLPDGRYLTPSSEDPDERIRWSISALQVTYGEEEIRTIGEDLDAGEAAYADRKSFIDALVQRVYNERDPGIESLLPRERETVLAICRRLRNEGEAWYGDQKTARLTKDQRLAVAEALKYFGPDALWTPLPPRELGLNDLPGHPDHDLDDLRSLVRARINRLWILARRGTKELREDARTQLEKILSAFVPDTRGRKRGPQLKPAELLLRYGDFLLRWILVKPEYERRYGSRPTTPNVAEIAKVYRLPLPTARAYFGLDAPSAPTTPRKLALGDLAMELQITPSSLEQQIKAARRARPTRSKAKKGK